MKSTLSELYRFVYRNVTFLLLCFAFVAELVCNSARFLNLIQQRKRAKLPENLLGKIVFITGANSGIGKETAKVCLKLGATVIMACRNRVKTDEALKEICAELGKENVYENVRENVFQVELDLSSLESVQKCAQKVNSKFPFIDVLINNAGVMMCYKFMTKDNFEGQFGTNYLGHFALTKLLLDKLKLAPSGRIVNLSSVAHLCGQLDLDNLNLDDDCYTPFRAYSRSKLAMLLFTRELENETSKVKTYAVHPGVVSTEIKRHLHFVIRIMEKVFRKVVMLSAEMGAQTTLHCAFSEEVSRETGFYYTNCTRVDNHLLSHVTNRKDSQNLWKLSVQLCNLT